MRCFSNLNNIFAYFRFFWSKEIKKIYNFNKTIKKSLKKKQPQTKLTKKTWLPVKSSDSA